MNKKIRMVYNILLLLVTAPLYAGGLIEIGKRLAGPDKIFTGMVEQRQSQLESFTQDIADLKKEKKESEELLQQTSNEVARQREQVQSQIKEQPDDQFLQRKESILNETFGTIKDIERVRTEAIDTLEDAIKAFTDYLNDPDFTAFRKERKLNGRLFYSFEDIEKLHELIADIEKKRQLLLDKEKNIQVELENRKRIASTSKENFKDKKDELEALLKTEGGDSGLTVPQVKELLTLEDQLNTYRSQLLSLRIKDTEYKLALAGMQSYLAKSHKKIFEEFLKKIKSEVQVSQSEISEAQEALNKQQQQYFASKEKIQQELDQLLSTVKKKEQELEELAKKNSIGTDVDVDIWLTEPHQTTESYVGFCEVGAATMELAALTKKQQLLGTQLTLEDERLSYYKSQLQVRETYYKMATKKFVNEEEITLERKKYEAQLAEAKARLIQYKERINLNADMMSQTKRVLDNIARFKANIEEQKALLFKGKTKEYTRCIELLKKSDQYGQEQIDILSKLAGVYSSITSQLAGTIRLLEFVTSELESKTILARPESAIPWQEIKNVIPDTLNFFKDITRELAQFSFFQGAQWFYRIAKQPPFELFLFILQLFLILLFLYGIKRIAHPLSEYVLTLGTEYHGLVKVGLLLLGGLASFVAQYFWWLALWALLYGALLLLPAPKLYLLVIFYLASIPYLLYIANRFIRFMAQFNTRQEYPFLAQEFQRRFVYVMSGLTYTTIAILFFRAAFMLANYRSDLPTILLALNFIIFQISLILLIDKEQILHLIPTKTTSWQWVHDMVNRYYYILQMVVIAIIIMSNPYVGFGKLVLYMLFGFIYTSLLIVVLFWLHSLFKRAASEIFFATQDEVVKERFDNAKTWFGVVVILSFLFCALIGFVVGARIWGWHITWAHMQDVLDTKLMGTVSEPVTLTSLIHIMLFLLGGLVVAYSLNRFVLDRIFDLLLVDAGVQHTVTSLLQYLVIALALFIGFNYANLGTVVNYIIGALILGLSWMLKDPINDFVAYFIILVQRPIKIGDFIKIDEHTTGVVRKITPRSVVLRRKNSVTIIVPNTYVIGHSIQNWNYARNFIALEDIKVVVGMSEDPIEVKQLLLEIAENNPNILRNPKPFVRLDHFSDYGFDFMLRVFVSSNYTLEQWNIASDIRIAIIQEFRKHGIELAVPVRLMIKNNNINQYLDELPSAEKEMEP